MRNQLKEAIEAMIDLVTDDWRHRDIEANEFDGMEQEEVTSILGEDETTTLEEDEQLYNDCLCFCHDIQATDQCEYCECSRPVNWLDESTDEEAMDYEANILDEDEDEVFNPYNDYYSPVSPNPNSPSYVGYTEDNPIVLD